MKLKLRSVKDSGFTLIEVITTIVVIGIAGTALLSVFGSLVRTSVDPMLQQQAITIAEAYMEEILLKDFNDPDGIGGETRPEYDDVMDYDGLTNAAIEDQNGNPVAALAQFTISVTVVADSLNGVPAVASRRIDVTVNHAAIASTVLSGYRMNY